MGHSLPAADVAKGEGDGRREIRSRKNGDYFAVSRKCRHLRADLANGSIDPDGCLVCPWHQSKYDVTTGRMVRGPQGIFAKIPGLGQGFMALTKVLPLRRGVVTKKGCSSSHRVTRLCRACGRSARQPVVHPSRWAGDPAADHPSRRPAAAPRRHPPPGRHLPRHRHRRPAGAASVPAAPRRRSGRRAAAPARALRRPRARRPTSTHVLRPLLACGAVVDARSLQVRRPRLRVALHDDAGSRPLARAIGHALTDLGIRIPRRRRTPTCCSSSAAASRREPCSSRPSGIGITHLPVVLDEDRVRIGPLVIPGVTPCLTCLDLNRTDWDRAWPALLPQLGRSPWTIAARAPGAARLRRPPPRSPSRSSPSPAGRARVPPGRCSRSGPAHDARVTWPVAFHHGCACALLPAA